jgi:tetratricopeptide (TPR) repeat protein
MKTIILSLLIVLSTGQSEVSKRTYQAYIQSSQALWKRVVNDAEAAYQTDKSPEALFDLVLAEYGLLNSTMSDQNQDLFEEYIDQIDEHLDELMESEFRNAECHALVSAVSGLKIAYSPWKGMLLGPKSGYFIDEAMSMNEQSAIVQKLYANYLLFTPEMWGGDVSKSITHYQHAIEKFEREADTVNWMYLDALVWQSQAYLKQGESDRAIKLLEKVATISPEFAWVTQVLLPEARKS